MYISSVLAIVALLATMAHCDPAPRLTGGQEVDNLRQFPHHVLVIPTGTDHKCGGSILKEHWILTSAKCIQGSARLELHFGKKNRADNVGDYFTVSVSSEQIYVYPTNHDDLALIRIPLDLVFTDTINKVKVSKLSIDTLRGRFAVLPGFSDDVKPGEGALKPINSESDALKPINSAVPVVAIQQRSGDYDNLKYGMFKVMDNSLCQRTLGSGHFEEYSQICTEGWGPNANKPCDSDFGSSLLYGWPANSELIGIFSANSPSCDSEQPAVYTYIPKYAAWIDSMILG